MVPSILHGSSAASWADVRPPETKGIASDSAIAKIAARAITDLKGLLSIECLTLRDFGPGTTCAYPTSCETNGFVRTATSAPTAPTIHAINAFDGRFNMYFLNSAIFGWRDSSIPESHNIGNLPFGREGVNTYWFRYRACRGGFALGCRAVWAPFPTASAVVRNTVGKAGR